MEKKWISFDLDGTLMQNPFQKWVFPEIAQIVETETNYKNIIADMVEEHNKRMKAHLYVDAYDWDNILLQTLQNKNVQVEIDIEKIVIKHAHQPKVALLEKESLGVLRRLKQAGYSLAVVTNGYSKYQLPVLKTLKLLPLFDLVLTPDRLGSAKPDIGIAKKLMVNDNTLIAHVGDRIDHDVVFGNELGVSTIFIYRNLPKKLFQYSPKVRHEIEECLQLIKLKWQKESGKYDCEISSKQIPTIVIGTIGELDSCLDW